MEGCTAEGKVVRHVGSKTVTQTLQKDCTRVWIGLSFARQRRASILSGVTVFNNSGYYLIVFSISGGKRLLVADREKDVFRGKDVKMIVRTIREARGTCLALHDHYSSLLGG